MAEGYCRAQGPPGTDSNGGGPCPGYPRKSLHPSSWHSPGGGGIDGLWAFLGWAAAPGGGSLCPGAVVHGRGMSVPGAAAAPGVLLAAASWVWVPDPLPKNCRGVSQSIPKLHSHGRASGSPPCLALCFPPHPPQGLHRGTSLTDPFPKTGTPPNWGAGCWGSKLQCLMLCGAGRGWLLQPPPTSHTSSWPRYKRRSRQAQCGQGDTPASPWHPAITLGHPTAPRHR